MPLDQWFEPAAGFRSRLWNAGHILGATSAEVAAGDVRLLCSGDLGPQNKAFLADSEGPSGMDYVVCESTYGSRTRAQRTLAQRRDLLEEEINTAIARGGNPLIRAFALEPTQELLLDIAYLAAQNRIPRVPVFVDSPLANRANSVFARHASELEDLGGKDIFHHPAIGGDRAEWHQGLPFRDFRHVKDTERRRIATIGRSAHFSTESAASLSSISARRGAPESVTMTTSAFRPRSGLSVGVDADQDRAIGLVRTAARRRAEPASAHRQSRASATILPGFTDHHSGSRLPVGVFEDCGL